MGVRLCFKDKQKQLLLKFAKLVQPQLGDDLLMFHRFIDNLIDCPSERVAHGLPQHQLIACLVLKKPC